MSAFPHSLSRPGRSPGFGLLLGHLACLSLLGSFHASGQETKPPATPDLPAKQLASAIGSAVPAPGPAEALAPKPPAPPPHSDPAAPPAPVQPAPAEQVAPAPPPAPQLPVITAQDFLRLWNESNLEDKLLRQRPPAEGVVRSANYTATLAGQPGSPTGIMVQADLQLQSLQKGWSVVPISSQALPVVKSETGNAFLTVKDQGYLALLPDEGTYQIQLTLVFPVAMLEGTPTADIRLPQSPVATFHGTIPGLGWQLNTLRNTIPVRTFAEGADTKFTLSPGSFSSFQLQWEKPEDDKAREPVIFAESDIQTLLRPNAVSSEAKIAFQLPRAPVSSVKVSVSPEHEILSVAGEAVKTWKIQKQPKSQELEVWFATPRRERAELRLVLEQSLAQLPASASLPVLRIEGALRQGGRIEIVEEQDVTTTLDALQNLTRQASNFRASPSQRHLGSYRFLRNDYSATLKMIETTPQISANADTQFHIEDALCSFATNLRLDIQGRAILQAVVILPAGFELQKVEGDAVKSFEVKGSRLTIAFKSPVLGQVQMDLTGKKSRRDGIVEEQDLPHFTVENSVEFRGRIRLDYPPSIQVDTRNEASPMALRPAPKTFEYLNTLSPSSLVVTRKPPQVEVIAAEEVQFRHHETTIRCTLDYQVRNRFPDRLLLRIPASLASAVEFRSDTLSVIDRQTSPNPGAASRADDESLYTYWALHDPNRTLGAHHVELSITDKLPDPLYNQPLISPSLLIIPLQTDRLEGKLEVSVDENVVLKPVTQTAVRTLTGEPAAPGRGPSFEFSSTEADLTFAVTRLRYVELPSLAVDLQDVTHVVSGDGSISTEIACRVIADQPADLEIQLPPGARMNSQVFCNDAPIAPRQTTEENLVAVTIRPEKKASKSADTIVRFTYDVPTPLLSKSLGNRGNLPIPVALLRNAKTLDSRTTLYLPPAFQYFDFATPMTLQSKILGWVRAKQYLFKLFPSLEAWTGKGTEVSEPATVTAIPPFEYRVPLRKEGQKFTFAYSAAPDLIAVSYLSQRYATLLEAGAFFLALLLGILLSRQSIEAKLVFLVFMGALALVASSFTAPHLATIYQAVCLGAVTSILFWLAAGILSLFRGFWFRAIPSAPAGIPPAPEPLFSEPRPATPEESKSEFQAPQSPFEPAAPSSSPAREPSPFDEADRPPERPGARDSGDEPNRPDSTPGAASTQTGPGPLP